MPSPASVTIPPRSDAGPPSTAWRSHAACRGANPLIFTTSSSRAWFPYCERCPVAEPCLWQALADEAPMGYRSGIWGGTTAARRQRIVESLPAETDYDAAYRAALEVWAAR
jgi:hypothetical protein